MPASMRVRALNRVDLPTLGLPMTPTSIAGTPSHRVVGGDLGETLGAVHGQSQGEEEIGQAVQPLHQLRSLRVGAVKLPHLALGPARDGPGDVQGRAPAGSPREDEGMEGFQPSAVLVELGLKTQDVPGLDAMGNRGTAGGGGHLGLGDEQLVLEAEQQFRDRIRAVREESLSEAERGAQLVEGPEGADPGRVLP
jgi:hypothetical protein